MTGTTDLARMSAERKVADAIILERAVNVLGRRYPELSGFWPRIFITWHVRALEGLAAGLRAEAEDEWERRGWRQ